MGRLLFAGTGTRGSAFRRPAARVLCLTAALLTVAACQTTAPPPPPAPPPPAEEGPGKPLRSGKGWTVYLHKPDGAKPYCRADKPSRGARLTFRTGAAEASLTLSDTGKPVQAGQDYDLTASFDTGATLPFQAKGMPDGSLRAAIPPAQFLEELDPFGRARRVTFRSEALGGTVASIPLSGSSWAINASDECRILNAAS
ncbi:hypothetical protein [Azospirillum thermophilum]|uniref:Uncharacterized protein n=1 Tax=Azospirillum thermophilum TaxID=2202148 RepID=A0A2S2CMR9_9PROT|nr:hypothetical protein [Azospirillum thermophilum]AWK85772.1 hypothetical protein DEW08_05970 [Azospirillum thermophilum]